MSFQETDTENITDVEKEIAIAEPLDRDMVIQSDLAITILTIIITFL